MISLLSLAVTAPAAGGFGRNRVSRDRPSTFPHKWDWSRMDTENHKAQSRRRTVLPRKVLFDIWEENSWRGEKNHAYTLLLSVQFLPKRSQNFTQRLIFIFFLLPREDRR